MRSKKQRAEARERWQAQATEMYDELVEWREQHPGASFDEIANQVTTRRQELMGELVNQLAVQHGHGEVVERTDL